ncbi:hypothetical protein C8J45_105303 [Sphingomonas sp. PP-CE-3G-477]|nr:hypothetical protein C8J45_105303 [Sphingomonas sp. PP-CE-3G-477]
MDDQSLRNILAILRKVQELSASQNVTAMQFINYLATGNRPGASANMGGARGLNQSTAARISAYLIEQCNMARIVIDHSQLVDEAKAGVRSAIDAVSAAFAIGALGGPLNSLNSSAPGFISNLVILLSAAGVPFDQNTPLEAVDLAKEVDDLIAQFDNKEIDPVVRDVARKHLAALSTMLRHIPIFGLEAALQAYFELSMKLRRADIQTTPESKAGLDTIMDKVKSWGDKLQTLDGVMNTGANLFDRASRAAPLLQYLPPLG